MKLDARYYRGSVDSHAHLHLIGTRDGDPAQGNAAADAALEAGMRLIVEVGIVPSDFAVRRAAFGDHAVVALTAGLHPTSIEPETWRGELDLLETQIGTDATIVAVGELGLDFFHSREHVDLQMEAIEFQFELARRHGLPVIIHNRESESEMLALLRERRPRGVMHCFSQDEAYCREVLDCGMHVSFGGNITYKHSEAIRAAARLVPEDRLLVETDAPFLSPQPVRGRKNTPGHLAYTIDALAQIRGVEPQRLAEITGANAAELFSRAMSTA